MLLSSLFILSQRGEVIIELQCRRNESRRVVDAFWSACMAPRATSVSLAPSVVVFEHLVFSTCRVKDVVLLGVSHDEGPALLVLEELMMVTRLLHDYLKQLTEPILRENFSVVFQILQELLDHGYPLTTELYWLEKLVPKPTLEVKVRNLLDDAGGMPESPLASRHSGRIGQSFCHSDRLESSMIPWRSSAVFHTTNELLFDVREVHDWVVDADGRVTQSSIHGSIEVMSRLSGMPEVELSLAYPPAMLAKELMATHRCVTYDHDVLRFTPPDGKFVLLTYLCRPPTVLPTLPFYVTPQVTFHRSGGRINCMVGRKSSHDGGLLRAASSAMSAAHDVADEVHDVVIRIALPPSVLAVNVQSSSPGTSAYYDRTSCEVVWTVGQLTHSRTPALSAEFDLGSDGADKHAGGAAVMPLSGTTAVVHFRMPNHSASGLCVRGVEVRRQVGSPSYKGVKYFTEAGRCVVRTG